MKKKDIILSAVNEKLEPEDVMEAMKNLGNGRGDISAVQQKIFHHLPLFRLDFPILTDPLQLYHMRINFPCVHQFFRRPLFGGTTV